VAAEPVEIKINVAGAVDAAVDVLSLDDGEARDIYFAEDTTPGLASSHPLLAAGVVLRLRREADGAGDTTAKLRPCRRSQLMARWSADTKDDDDHWVYRIEGDLTGSRRVLAASLVQDLSATELAAGLGDPARAFGRQTSFLDDCAAVRVNLAALTMLGPVRATKWSKIKVGSVKKVNAERWRVGSLDFLELSRRVDADEAAAALAELTLAVLKAGLMLDTSSASKTEQVLDALA